MRLCKHALVIFDRDGCGSVEKRETLESNVEKRLAQNGWQDRGVAVAIDPELEVWVWGDSPHVLGVLDWPSSAAELKSTLEESGYLNHGVPKPHQPKEAFDHVLRLSNKKHSSALFLELAQQVSFEGCVDPAFLKLKLTLQKWFGHVTLPS